MSVQAFPVRVSAMAIDPVQWSCHEIRKNRSDLMDVIRAATTFREVFALAQEIHCLAEEFDALYVLATSKADSISEGKR
jgi:hypothetical protein